MKVILQTLMASVLGVSAIMPARAQVRVVNMIPRHMSDETFQNAEPSLAVNPRNVAQMAASAYTAGGDLCSRGGHAPIFVTADSGKHWSVACKIRVDASTMLPPGDVSLSWSDDGKALYAALLWPFTPLTLQVYQTTDPFSAEDLVLLYRIKDVDQPDIESVSINGKPHVFVVADYFDADTGKNPLSNGTAVVIATQPGSPSAADTTPIPVEQRKIFGNNYSIRVAAHPSGTVYALFYSPRKSNRKSPFVIEDVVVVRDDSAGASKNPFTALRDLPARKATNPCNGRDGLPGFRVARCAIVPYPDFNDVASFGNERRVSANISITVDPEHASNVWVAWADSINANHYTLHVRRSLDAGKSWSQDLLTIPNATNPALAVASAGNAGFLFQQLQGSGTKQRWVTRLFTSSDGFKTRRSYTLATVPSNVPQAVIQPYIGDYLELRAVGQSFYGVFSAANTPDTLNFPNGIKFERNADFVRHLLLNAHGGTTIGVSIDPFFFMVGPNEEPSCNALRAKRDPRALQIGCR